MLLEGVGVADGDGDDPSLEALTDFRGKGFNVLVGEFADIALIDLAHV